MRICFFANGPKSGLSLNGGSRTIVKSAETLQQLGHDVTICARHNKYTWKNSAKVVRSVTENTDVLVAVSAKDVKNCLKHPAKKHAWWMRGIETWAMPEEKIIERAKSIPVIVNASHLKTWLSERGVKSQLCFAGIDSFWKQTGPKASNRIGCLYHSKHKTKRWDDFWKLATLLGYKEYEYVGFGVGRPSDISWLAEYHDDPSPSVLRDLYSSCRYWFAPTTLEGFHNVAAEAGLCGCVVIANDMPHSGMSDYIGNGYHTLEGAVEMIRDGYFEDAREKLEEIGSREKCMKGFIECLS